MGWLTTVPFGSIVMSWPSSRFSKVIWPFAPGYAAEALAGNSAVRAAIATANLADAPIPLGEGITGAAF